MILTDARAPSSLHRHVNTISLLFAYNVDGFGAPALKTVSNKAPEFVLYVFVQALLAPEVGARLCHAASGLFGTLLQDSYRQDPTRRILRHVQVVAQQRRVYTPQGLRGLVQQGVSDVDHVVEAAAEPEV